MTAMCLKRMVMNQIVRLQDGEFGRSIFESPGMGFATDSTPSEPANNRWAGAKSSNCKGR